MNIIMMILQDAFWSGIAAMGFAILFNVPRNKLLFCIITGAVGHATRTFMVQQFGFGIEAATLVGATAVGFLAKGFAMQLKTPSMIFAVCGVIPMVPGKFAYSTMIAVLELAGTNPGMSQDVLLAVAVNGVKTGLILGAIALGITAPVLIFQRRKPIV